MTNFAARNRQNSLFTEKPMPNNLVKPEFSELKIWNRLLSSIPC